MAIQMNMHLKPEITWTVTKNKKNKTNDFPKYSTEHCRSSTVGAEEGILRGRKAGQRCLKYIGYRVQ